MPATSAAPSGPRRTSGTVVTAVGHRACACADPRGRRLSSQIERVRSYGRWRTRAGADTVRGFDLAGLACQAPAITVSRAITLHRTRQTACRCSTRATDRSGPRCIGWGSGTHQNSSRTRGQHRSAAASVRQGPFTDSPSDRVDTALWRRRVVATRWRRCAQRSRGNVFRGMPGSGRADRRARRRCSTPRAGGAPGLIPDTEAAHAHRVVRQRVPEQDAARLHRAAPCPRGWPYGHATACAPRCRWVWGRTDRCRGCGCAAPA